MKPIVVTALTALTLIGSPVSALRDDAPAPAPPAADRSDLSLSLRAGGSHTFRADLEDDGGDVSVTRAGAGVGVSWAPASKLRLSLGFDTEFSWYEFGSDAGIDFENLLEDGLEHDLSLSASYQATQALSVTVFGSVNAGYEPGADFGDSLTYAAGAAVGFDVNKSLSLRLGAAFRTRLEDDALVLPVLGVVWKINDTTTLTTEGLGGRITAQVRDDLGVYLRAGAEIHEFRLDDDNDVLPGGVLSDVRVPIGLGVTWEPAPSLSLAFEGGAVVWQEYELRDDDDEVGDAETDPAAYIGFRLSWSF